MALPQPGIQTTIPGISLPEVAAGTVSTDSTLTGDGSVGSQLSVRQSYLLFLGSFLTAALPAAAAHRGAVATVTDSNTIIWGATVVGGGAAFILAFSDGTNWTVAAI